MTSGLPIPLMENQEFLDTTGWHSRASYGLGTT